MPRFFLIDNCSGYIFGDSADLDGKVFVPSHNSIEASALEYAAALDASLGEHGRAYAIVGRHSLASNECGYHVYRDASTSDAVPVVHDGQDAETIAAVERDCEYVASIRIAVEV